MTEPALLPTPGGRLVEGLLVWSIVTSAWLSMTPYFVWDARQAALMAGAAAAGLAALLQLWQTRARPWPRDIGFGLLLAAFLVYITAQRTVAGGHAYWIFVLPTLAALIVAPLHAKARAFDRFELVFCLSLLPGLVLLLLMIAGVPLTFSTRPAPNPLFAANGVRMLEGPGGVFIESNSQLLPWGGVISRLCGMYDEPGMVGTIAALLLAVRRFVVSGVRSVFLWLVGLLSLSLAFVIISVAGLAARAVFTRDWRPLVWAVPIVAAGLFTLGIISLPSPPKSQSPPPTPRAVGPSGQAAPVAVQNARVRQVEDLNNRSRPEMDNLVARYVASPWQTRLLGMASDASVVYGGASAVWTRVLTNHGVVGLVLLVAAFGGYALAYLRHASRAAAGMLYFLIPYAVSFYQRPVIWLPYALLIFVGGLAVLGRSALSDRPPHRSPASP